MCFYLVWLYTRLRAKLAVCIASVFEIIPHNMESTSINSVRVMICFGESKFYYGVYFVESVCTYG